MEWDGDSQNNAVKMHSEHVLHGHVHAFDPYYCMYMHACICPHSYVVYSLDTVWWIKRTTLCRTNICILQYYGMPRTILRKGSSGSICRHI